MPRIPQYQRSGKIQQQQVAPKVSPTAFTASGRSLEEVGDTLLKMEEKLTEVRDTNQTTQAQIEHSRKIREIQAKALQDPDLDNNLQSYLNEIRESSDEISGKISSPGARGKFAAKVALSNTALEFDLGSEARKTMSKKAKAGLEELTNEMKEQFYNAPNEAIRQQILQGLSDEYQERINQGLIDPIKGNEAMDDLNDELRSYQLNKIIDHQPDVAIELLNSGNHGIEDSKTVEELKSKAEKKLAADVKAGKALLTDAQDRNEIQFFNQHAEGKTTLSLLDELDSNGELSPDFVDKMEANSLSADRFVESSDQATLNDLTKEVYSKKKPEQARKLFREIIQANTDGKITIADMKRLGDVIAAEYQNKVAADRHNWFYNGLERISGWVKDNIPFDKDTVERNMQAELMRKYEQGEDIDESKLNDDVKKLIANEIIRRHPALATHETLPSAVYGKDGFSQAGTDPARKSAAKVTYTFKDGKLVASGGKEEKPKEGE